MYKKIKKYIKKIFYIRLWIDFFVTLIRVGNKDFYIYSNQIWHYDISYIKRRDAYKVIGDYIYVDINNKFMFMILFFLKGGGSIEKKYYPNNNISCDDVIISRNMWDLYIRNLNNNNFPDLYSYKKEYDIISDINKKKNKLIVKFFNKLSENPKFLGLIITQPSYEDWVWALICMKHEKKVYEPEGIYGLTEYNSKGISNEIDFLKENQEKLTKKDLKNGIISLKNRVLGNYSGSIFNGYYKDKDKSMKYSSFNIDSGDKCTYIFYLHSFSDSPNNSIFNYELETQDIDYYAITLRLIDLFISSGRFLVIKPHPVSYKIKFDLSCLNHINKLINNHKNIILINDNISIIDIKNYIKNPIVISGKGSVCLEASFIGVPVILINRCLYSELNLAPVILIGDNFFNESEFYHMNNNFSLIEKRKKSILIESIRYKFYRKDIYAIN